MADLRIYRESTRYVYATITSATDPSAGDVWMAVVRQGVPAAASDLKQAEWVPDETWTGGQRRARLLIGPESTLGQLAGGAYRVYSKTDLGAEVPFEPAPYRLVITTETGAVDTDPVELAAVAFTGQYDDLIGAPAGGGSGGGLGSLPLFNIESHGAVADGTTDNSAALEAAWNAMLAFAKGGVVFGPTLGVYRFATPPSAMQAWTDQQRAVFPFPMRSRQAQKLVYGLRGVGEAYTVRAADLGGSPGQVATATVFWFDYDPDDFAWSDTTGLPSIFGCTDADMTDFEGNTFSNVHIVINDLILRSPSNPSVCVVNAEQASTLRMDNVRFDVNVVLDDIPEPTHPTGAAILLPRSNNNVVVDVGRVVVEGYYAGLPLTEHLRCDSVIALRCKIALPVRRLCSHIGLIHHAKVEQCTWGVAGYDPSGEAPNGGVVPVPGWTGHIGVLDIEDYAYNGNPVATPFYAPTFGAHVYDAEGKLNGEIGFLNRVNSEPITDPGIGVEPTGGGSSLYVIGPSGTNSPIAIYGAHHGISATRLASPNAPAVNLYRLWDAVTPSVSSATDTGLNLGTKIQVVAAAEATRLAFWKPADVTGVITGRLWHKDGSTYTQVGADVTFSFDPSFEGWVFAELPTPVALDVATGVGTGAVYIPTVHFPTTYPFTGSYWDSGGGGSGIIAGPLRAYSSTDAGGQGTFSTGAITNPPSTVSSSGACYWVDMEMRSAA